MLRKFRGWLYRRYPTTRTAFRKKLAGHERVFDLESSGFTKEGFFQIFQNQILADSFPGEFAELVAGDGLVGSLGVWLERLEGWKVEAWEHRPAVRESFRQHRPRVQLHAGRLTDWSRQQPAIQPVGITARGAREAAGICRAIRQELIRPRFVGIWNPSQRPVWYHRLCREGYRLEAVWQNIEIYVDKRRGTEDGGQRPEGGGRKTGLGRQRTEGRGRKTGLGGRESGVGKEKGVNE